MGTELALAGVFLTAFGQYQAGKQDQEVANRNAHIAEQQASAARTKAAFDELQQKKEAKKFKGTQRTRIAKSGVTAESFTDVLMETSRELELDALAIRYGGDLAASQKINEADALRYGGKQVRTASYINMGSTLLKGIGSYKRTA